VGGARALEFTLGRLVDVEIGVLVDAANTQQDSEPTANFSLRDLKMVPVRGYAKGGDAENVAFVGMAA
jgi:hypothetical protein